jgi:murein DD-endopeptidase MepM/ murein hydrolase activator NlpD
VAKIPAKQRHEEVHFEELVLKNLEHDIHMGDLWKSRIRVLARTVDGMIDISTLCDGVSWQDRSSDDLKNINTQAAMTGSITLKKPALRQYNKLLVPTLSARVVNGVDRMGALGVVVIAQIGYGKHYLNLWAMRVTPGFDADVAETVTLADGSWTLTLTDDLWTIAQTVADFKYTAGKKIRKKGWRCDEIAADVCKRYRIPVRTLSQGTAYFSLTTGQTHKTSPAHVITAAYHEEFLRTGRTFIIRWGPPGKKFPFGALEVIPMRRNRDLTRFREQILDATLSRSQAPGFATIIEAHGTLRQKKGKQKKLVHTETSKDGLKRFGWILKTVNFGEVQSELELKILAKRSLAQRLTPIRTAEINHPGFATIRRGDAIHIDIPEEGYANVPLNALQTPKGKKPKWLIEALKDAEKKDPTMFDQTPQQVSGPSADPFGNPPPHVLPIANQGIAFVTTAAHSVASGSYTMDLSTSFIDVLDPARVRAQVDKTIRDWKNRGKNKKPKTKRGSSSTASGTYDGSYPLGVRGQIIGTPYTGTHTLGNWQSDNAVDIGVPVGTDVIAVTDGTVHAGGSWSTPYDISSRFSGMEVPLDGDDGQSFFYQHLSQRFVSPNDHVSKGDVIGKSGGGNGVPHLHIAAEPPYNPLHAWG